MSGKVELLTQEPRVVEDMDQAYELAGGVGKYQLLVGAGCCLSACILIMYISTIPYFLVKPPAECNLNGVWKSCTSAEICKNPNLHYRLLADSHYNFVTEFDLYCDDHKGVLLASAYFMGQILSCLFISTLSDIFGKLPILVLGHIGNFVGCGLILLWPSFPVCVLASFFLGALIIASLPNTYNFIFDSFQSRYAAFNATLINTASAVAEIIVALVIWTGFSWRVMLMVVQSVSVAFFVLMYWLRESPRFYFSKLRLQEAVESLRYMAEVNGRRLPERLSLNVPAGGKVENEDQTALKTLLRQMCCSSPMASRITLFAYAYFVMVFLFYAVSLNLDKMSGNVCLNGFLTSLAEIPAYFVSLAILRVMSKKLSVILFFFIAAVSIFIQGWMWESSLWSAICAYATKTGATGAGNLLAMFVAELFPTAIKGGAFGIASFTSRFGGMMAKPLALLEPFDMCLINALLCLLAILACLFLPLRENAVITDIADDQQPTSCEKAA